MYSFISSPLDLFISTSNLLSTRDAAEMSQRPSRNAANPYPVNLNSVSNTTPGWSSCTLQSVAGPILLQPCSSP